MTGNGGEDVDPAQENSGCVSPDEPVSKDPLDYEARFADIVALWDSEPAAPRPGQPGMALSDPATSADSAAPPDPEDLPDPEAPDTTAPRSPATNEEPRPDADQAFGPAVPWCRHRPEPEPEEDFHPAPPAPLPRNDLGFWGATIGVVVGPLWLIFLVVTDPYGSRLLMGLALALTLGGLALIVARLPSRSLRDDDDDDGAVV